MAPIRPLLVLLGLLVWSTDTEGTSLLYKPLMEYLGTVSDPDVIPITDDRLPVEVTVGMSLVDVVEVDDERNQVDVIAWQTLAWKNPALAWDPKRFNNLTSVRVPSHKMWIPDITSYNAASPMQVLTPQLAVLKNDGQVTYIPATRMRVMCDVAYVYTASGANCTLKLGSWTYSGLLLALDPNVHFDTSNFGSSKYELLSTTAERERLVYPCCPEPYEDVKFSFAFREKNGDRSWYQKLFDDDD